MNSVKQPAARVINSRVACQVQPNAVPPMNDSQIDCVANTISCAVNFAAALDLKRRPRFSRTNAENVEIHSRQQADKRSRNMVVHTAIMWGWRDAFLTNTRHEYIAKAACKQVAYDLGYHAPLAYTCLPYWYGMINYAITSGENSDSLLPSNSGRTKYLDTVEQEHPGYLRELYRYAKSVLGALATWPKMAENIDQKSAALEEECPTLSISRRQLATWFQKEGGKEVSAIKKPLLTTEHKEKRINWGQKWFHLLSDPAAPVAFLDEKWFYTTNRRRRMKILPSTVAEGQRVQAYGRK